MGRVTIDHLDFDFNHTEIEKHDNVADIEVVPRKIVEMIIEHLYEQMNACAEGGYADYVLHNSIKYAESLLKQFEENDNE